MQSTTAPADPGPTTVDAAEVAKFAAMAAEWWDPAGPFKPLHMLNPCRLDYIIDQVTAEFGRDPRRSGRWRTCGCSTSAAAELLAEPMARLGAEVVGADAAAGEHRGGAAACRAGGAGDRLSPTTAEALAAAGERFDVVLNMEVVEHVADPAAFLAACRGLFGRAGL